MLDALNSAIERGEVIIPTARPESLRLEFSALRGALRHEGRPELADLVGLYVRKAAPGVEPALILRNKSQSPMMADIAAALGSTPSTAAEVALTRILGF